MPATPATPDRLTESEMLAIVTRRQDAARQGLDSYPAMRHHVFRQHATREADDRAMHAEFEAVLADVPPETAARLRLLAEFGDASHAVELMLRDWLVTMAEVEQGPEK